MTKRVLLAGLLGGVAMFLWASLAHIVLPLGEIGIAEMPNDAPVLAALRTALGERSGLYFFPGMGLAPDATREQKSAAMGQYDQKLAANPSGLLVYHPPGEKGFSPARLVTELLTEIVESLLAAFLLSLTRLTAYGSRVGFVAAAGLMAVITTNVSYWNWYGFPTNYTVAYAATQLVGYLAAGLVAAAILPKSPPAGAA